MVTEAGTPVVSYKGIQSSYIYMIHFPPIEEVFPCQQDHFIPLSPQNSFQVFFIVMKKLGELVKVDLHTFVTKIDSLP